MKKIAIVGLIIVVIVCGMLLYKQVKLSKDSGSRSQLIGTWSWEFYNERGTNTIAPNGSFDEQSVSTNYKGIKISQSAGTWQIKDGIFIETVTNDSRARARVPRIKSAQIVRVDARQFVIIWPDAAHEDDSTNAPIESVWQRVSQ